MFMEGLQSSQFPQPPRSVRPAQSIQSTQFSSQRRKTSGGNQAALLTGRLVKINRGGPESIEGRLLAVNGEVLVLSSQNVTVFVNGRHVKSITEKGSGGASTRSGGRSLSRSFLTESNFTSLLSRLRHQFVQINHGGPEKLEGFLAEVSSDFILLVVGRERVRIPIFHIKTVNVSGGGSRGSNNQSGGNQSGGSGGGSTAGKSHSNSGGKSRNNSGGRNRRQNRNAKRRGK